MIQTILVMALTFGALPLAAGAKVALFGKGNPASFDKMTDLVCRAMEEICGIAPDKCYVKYEEVSNWGWNNQNF